MPAPCQRNGTCAWAYLAGGCHRRPVPDRRPVPEGGPAKGRKLVYKLPQTCSDQGGSQPAARVCLNLARKVGILVRSAGSIEVVAVLVLRSQNAPGRGLRGLSRLAIAHSAGAPIAALGRQGARVTTGRNWACPGKNCGRVSGCRQAAWASPTCGRVQEADAALLKLSSLGAA